MDRAISKGTNAFVIFIIFVTIISLFISAFYSFRSFTGYVVSDEVYVGDNIRAFVFFLVGVVGAFIFLKVKVKVR